ncbi:MAG: GNAT family N-acetyltransferase [Chitinophagaceae bacterium]|nr:GNAT family N-acetyltransferase [Chitinophagaceae bacterium]
MHHIRYIQHEEIDKKKWDMCIKNSENRLIYGYSWWLDDISPGWHALILNNYEAVMPLTWRKKYGIYYLYQPFCTAALGVFYKKNINVSVYDFLKTIPPIYKYWDIDMNERNELPADDIITRQRKNQVLDLNKPYSIVRERYSRLAGRKLNKAKQHELVVVKDMDASTIIDLYKQQYRHAHRNSSHDYTALANCCKHAVDRNMITTYTAQSPEGEIVSFYIVLHDGNFVYSLLGGSTPEGKTSGSFYFLTDAAIRDNCNTGKTFRFEGSDNEGIAFFNSQFGAVSITYLHIQQNNLPFPLRLFKK